MSFSLSYLGAVQKYAGKYEAARQLIRQSLEICRQTEDRFDLSIALNILGQIAYVQGEYREAREFCQQSLDLARQLEHCWGIAFSLTNLGQVASALGQHVEAKQLFEESLQIRRHLNDPRGIAICLNHLGDVAQNQGAPAEARQRYEESLAIFSEIGNEWGCATSRVRLGNVSCRLGEYGLAQKYLADALRAAINIQAVPIALDALVGVATILVKTAKPERALELLAFIMNNPNSSRDNQNQAAQLLAELAQAGLASELVSAAQVRGKTQILESLVAELLD